MYHSPITKKEWVVLPSDDAIGPDADWARYEVDLDERYLDLGDRVPTRVQLRVARPADRLEVAEQLGALASDGEVDVLPSVSRRGMDKLALLCVESVDPDPKISLCEWVNYLGGKDLDWILAAADRVGHLRPTQAGQPDGAQ